MKSGAFGRGAAVASVTKQEPTVLTCKDMPALQILVCWYPEGPQG